MASQKQESGIDMDFDTFELDWKDFDVLIKNAEQEGYCELKWKPPPESPPQSAKSLSSTSRTQLKQQLMRQQLQQQEARERELKARRNLHQSSQQQHPQQHQQQPQQHQQQQHPQQQLQNQQYLYQQGQTQQQRLTQAQTTNLSHQAAHSQQQNQQEQQLQHHINQSQQQQNGQNIQQSIPVIIQDSGAMQSSTAAALSRPQQVLSRLENPTRYHMVQSQMRIMRQNMLNENNQEGEEHISPNNRTQNVPVTAEGRLKEPRGPQWPYSDPGYSGLGVTRGPNFVVGGQRPPSVPTQTVVTTNGIRGFTADRGAVLPQSAGCTPSTGLFSPPMNNPASYLSSGVSSAAASLTSDASEVDDVIEEILSLEEGLEAGNDLKKCDSQNSGKQAQGDNVSGTICDILGLNGYMGSKTPASCPPDVPKVKAEPQSNNDPQVVALMRDRQKKDNHNMIERRRRFNINDRIRDLSQLLPKNNEPYHEIVRDIRHNKGQILRASVDYIRRLKSDLERSKAAEDKQRALEQQNRMLLLRIQDLENRLRMSGINVEETNIDPNLLLSSIVQSDVMSPPSINASPITSPFTPTPTTSPFTPNNITTTSPLNPMDGSMNFTTANTTTNTTVCSSGGSDIHNHLNFCEDNTISSVETTNLLNDIGVGADPNDVKKVNNRCHSSTNLSDFLFEELFMEEFASDNFDLSLMDDDSLAFTSDPMFSSPQVSSPNSSHHSFEDALTPDSMDTGIGGS